MSFDQKIVDEIVNDFVEIMSKTFFHGETIDL